MSNIIGTKYKLSELPVDWKTTVRKCGMNDIMYISSRYPSRKEVENIRDRLWADECCILFDANDKVQHIYRAYGY